MSGLITAAITRLVKVMRSGSGASLLGFVQALAGAVATTIDAQLRLHISGIDFGAKFDLVNDDTAYIQAAIDNAMPNEEIFIGRARCLGKLNINKPVTLVGSDARNANLPDHNFSSSVLLFSNPANGGIIGNKNVTLKNLVVISYAEFGVYLTDASLMTENVVVQGGTFANIIVKRGYYNKFTNTRLESGGGWGCYFENCYNINSTGLSIRGIPSGIYLGDGSKMSMHGGSLEDFAPGGYGVSLRGGSSIKFFGTYFEGKVVNGVGTRCVSMGANSQVSAIGCEVYLNTMSQWLAIEDQNSTAVRVFSRNNDFTWPTDNFVTEAYSLLSSDATGSCDIEGDNWPNQSGGVPGPNCKYVGDVFTSGAGPVQNVGSYSIIYPPGHSAFGKNINTRPICANLSNSTPVDPMPGTMINFANNGTPGDDPLGLSSRGYGSYSAMYQGEYGNERWEKVGLRMTNQVNSTAATVPLLVADFNALLAKLRAAGVMV